MSIAALILGILSVASFIVSCELSESYTFLWIFSGAAIVIGIAAIFVGALARHRSKEEGMRDLKASLGFTLGIISVALCLCLILMISIINSAPPPTTLTP